MSAMRIVTRTTTLCSDGHDIILTIETTHAIRFSVSPATWPPDHDLNLDDAITAPGLHEARLDGNTSNEILWREIVLAVFVGAVAGGVLGHVF